MASILQLKQNLLKTHEKEYQSYGQNVPFIFPVPHHTEIPELLSSMVIALFHRFSSYVLVTLSFSAGICKKYIKSSRVW